MAANDLVVAMTGASGAPYGLRLLEVLLRAGRTVHLTLSPAAVQVLEQETDRRVRLDRHGQAHEHPRPLRGSVGVGVPLHSWRLPSAC